MKNKEIKDAENFLEYLMTKIIISEIGINPSNLEIEEFLKNHPSFEAKCVATSLKNTIKRLKRKK